MEQKVHEFLHSGLLVKYIIGDTTANETLKVEKYINTYPEVEEEYQILQDQLELASRAQATAAPDVLNAVLKAIDDKPVVQLQTKQNSRYWMTVAACIAALVFAGTSYVFYDQNKSLTEENDVIAEEIFDLRDDINKNNDLLDNVLRQLNRLNNPETQKYVLRGNERAKELKTVAYINPIEKSTLIDVVDLPKLSDEQVYQMWAQVQDKMINLGILDASSRNLKPMPYIENADGLTITIEPKGGNTDGSQENAVAKIPININNN